MAILIWQKEIISVCLKNTELYLIKDGCEAEKF